ncbi:TAXI family TRAP transporter solute-binding subunit [Ruegeria arenilitoris]|uniref:TAXI family TRAP transporter solute-binding subunit n=1 Tax=Ruegeria arenilitoris TaxID=1173585 RepID=UPI00147A438B
MFKTFCQNRLTRPRLSFAIIAAIFGSIAPASLAADIRMTVGTGGKGGYYFHIGDLVCKSFARETIGYKCQAKATNGPTENLPKLQNGKFDIVVARSDWAKQALEGGGFFQSNGQNPALRSLFSVHSEPLTIVARKDTGIHTAGDLSGKRVRLGRSATRLVKQIPSSANWDVSAFQTAKPKDMKAQYSALCAGKVDAVAAVVGYPSGVIQKTDETCPIHLVNLSEQQIDKLVAGSVALSKTTIPANVYTGITAPTKSLGYKAILLSSAEVSDEDIYAFVKSTFENLSDLGRKHPALSGLQPSEMIRDGLPAPMHPGAVRYYREQGWIK